MKERIKEIRNSLKNKDGSKMTQLDFANELGLAKATITAFETGNRVPADSVIELICQKYSINREWLRTGSGEMREPLTREAEIADLAAKLYGMDPDSFQYKYYMYLKDLPLEDWKAFESLLKDMSEKLL